MIDDFIEGIDASLHRYIDGSMDTSIFKSSFIVHRSSMIYLGTASLYFSLS